MMMKNSLAEVRRSVKINDPSKTLRVDPGYTGMDGLIVADHFFDQSKKAVAFYLGTFADVQEYPTEINPDFVRMPFKNIWLEFDTIQEGNKPQKCGIFISDELNNMNLVWFFQKPNKDWVLSGNAEIPHNFASGEAYLPWIELYDDFRQVAVISQRFLMQVNCMNIERQEQKSSAASAYSSGNMGIAEYSTWTLNLKSKSKMKEEGFPQEAIDANEDEPVKGTHASPRQHMRRGHFRNLSSGLRIWINECKVGNPKLGTIEKEYSLG